MQKRILAMLLAICFVISLLPTIALAEEDVLSSTDQYTDVSLEDAVAYLDGSGTEDDPFQIWNADDLYYINYIEYWRDTSGSDTIYYYQQMQDLDLADADQFDRDTGYITANFGGVYDGGDYAINGMTKSLFYFTIGDYIGDEDGSVFTDYVSGDSHTKPFSAIVRNLVIADPQITQTVATDVIEQLGAIAAYAVNTTFYNIEVTGGQISGVSGAAAIAGRAGSVVIDSCSSDTDIYTSMHRAAGIVSNLRIVDEKKGATATSLVTNCSFSGTISGNLDGERGSAGIVGAVYMDGESTLCGGAGLPLYVTDCTFSGTISGTVTSGSGNFGGILGTSYLGPGLYLKDNVVTGSIQDITVGSEATAANVGGVVGKMLNYSLLDSGISLVMENNDASQATLPDTDPENDLYVGTQLGCLNDPNRTINGAVSISTAEGLGEYGNLQGAQLAGEVGDLVLPVSSGSVQLYILEGATVNSVTADANTGLNIYNDGTLGNVTNTKNINIYANTGTLGDVTAQNGTVTVGYGGKTAETAGNYVGNEGGTIGNITGTSVTVQRNSGTIASLTATTGAVTIGQGSTTTAGVADYNVNSGSIGSVTAATSVSIQGGQVEGGSVAVGEGQSIQAGTTVSIGSNAVLNGAALVNQNDIGNVQAGTTVTVYNGEGVSMGDINAAGNVAINANAAGSTIGTVISTAGSITIGADNKSESNNGSGAYVGNEGTIGDLTAYTGVSVKRNTGTVGKLTSTTSSVTVGQGNATYVDYNTNSGTIGAVDAATSVGIYSTSNTGKVAVEDGQSIQAGTSVAIGGTSYLNENAVGPVNAGTTVTIYGGEQGTVGNVTADTSVAIGSTTVPSQGVVGAVDAGTTVTIYGGEQGNVGNVTADTSVTIGSTTAPNYSTVGTVTAPTVSGYTVGVVGTVNATTNKLVKADDTAGTGVITVAGSVTLTADENGTITADGKTYAAGSKLVLTKEGTVTFSGDYPVQLSSIESNGKLTLLDAGGKAEIGVINTVGDVILGNATVFAGAITGDVTATGSLTVGTSSVYFPGTIGGSLNITNNITIYNSGTIGTEHGNNAISTVTGWISITNGKSGSTPITGTIYSDVVNNSAANTTSITNNGTPMAGAICQSGTGNLTLSGTGTASQYTGQISVSRALTINGNIGANAAENAILVDFIGASGTISMANHSFYLKVTGSGLNALSVASTASTTGKNTVDLSGLNTSVNIAKAVGNENATTVILPAGATPPSSMGTLVSSTVDSTVGGDTYATGNVTVNDGVSLSADGTLTLTASSATITNYGTIGTIRHLGTGTLTIYNIGESATIGDVTSAGTINVGGSEKTAENANTAVGNEGTIGNMTAAVNVTVYRNTGMMGNVIAETGAVTIGQGSNTKIGVADYNVNSGSIGSVLAGTSVSIQGGQMEGGSVATGEGQSIQAGTTVTIGSNAVLNGAALLNQNDIGTVKTGTAAYVYNGDGQIGNIDADGSVTIYANSGVVGASYFCHQFHHCWCRQQE